MRHVIGIDFGNTITYKPADGPRVCYPDALRVIRRMVDAPDTSVYIISKVDEEQEKRAKAWIDLSNFYLHTGLTPANVHFCRERAEKGAIARDLGLTHHIDDRPEVMAFMPPSVFKYLYEPIPEDVVVWFNKLLNTQVVNNWLEVEEKIFAQYD